MVQASETPRVPEPPPEPVPRIFPKKGKQDFLDESWFETRFSEFRRCTSVQQQDLIFFSVPVNALSDLSRISWDVSHCGQVGQRSLTVNLT